MGLAIALALCTGLASAQTAVRASDPQALTLAWRSITALTGGHPVSDMTLTGNATWTVGDPETGTVALRALGSGESRVDLTLSGGTRTEIRDASAGVPQGKWTAQDGTSGMFASHNTLTDAVWFFPALGSLAAGPNIVLTYIGQESRNGQSVQHLRSSVFQPAPAVGAGPTEQQLSTMDFYLDAATLLPAAEVFNSHPDNDATVDIAVEIDYSDYQPIAGTQVPMHIQRSMSGSPILDITVTSAVVNSGLSLSEFSIN